MNSLFSQIQSAFAKRPHPGDENITHCSYETKNGGTLDGPCWECEEMSNFFRRKSWGMLHGLELRVMAIMTPFLQSRHIATFCPRT